MNGFKQRVAVGLKPPSPFYNAAAKHNNTLILYL